MASVSHSNQDNEVPRLLPVPGDRRPGVHYHLHRQQQQQQGRCSGNFNLNERSSDVVTLFSSRSTLDSVSPPLELVMDTRTTTLATAATGTMPTRDITADTTMLATTTEVTAIFLMDLSMVVDITLTTGTTNKNEKSFGCYS